MPSIRGLRAFINSIPDNRAALQIMAVVDRLLPNDTIPFTDTGLTAHAGGTQASGLPLNARTTFHEVTTVASAADSVLLPQAKVGEVHVVKNSGANSMQVFGSGTDTIDSVATATGVAQPAGEAVIYWCQVAGNYLRLGGIALTNAFGDITVTGITCTDSSLGIAGQAAAQGGAIALTGGASSTSGNAGGAVTVTGGAAGATGVGGAVTLTGAAGGATSGTGGAATLTGGAGTNGNALGGAATVTAGAGQGTGNGAVASLVGGASGAGATGNGGAVNVTGGAAASTAGTGGAVTITGGLGTTTGAGGAVNITSGAAGATGVAGAIAISVGGATAGNGSAITITAGSGAGGTASGGNLNLVAGAAVSTGTPGEVQVNGDSSLMTVNVALTATDATRTVFVATRACRLKAVKEVHSTASSSGTLQLEKCTSTTAPGSGTSLLTGTMSLSGTANTVVSGTLSSTVATITLAAGDRISIVIAGTMTNIVGGLVTLTLAPA